MFCSGKGFDNRVKNKIVTLIPDDMSTDTEDWTKEAKNISANKTNKEEDMPPLPNEKLPKVVNTTVAKEEILVDSKDGIKFEKANKYWCVRTTCGGLPEDVWNEISK